MSLCSLACSNSGLMSAMAALMAPLVSTRSSAACAFIPMAHANAAVMIVIVRRMTFSPVGCGGSDPYSGPVRSPAAGLRCRAHACYKSEPSSA